MSYRASQSRNDFSGQVESRRRTRHIQQFEAEPGHDVPEDEVDERELDHDAQCGASNKLKGQNRSDRGAIEGRHGPYWCSARRIGRLSRKQPLRTP